MTHTDSVPSSSNNSSSPTAPLLWFGPHCPLLEATQRTCAVIHVTTLEAAWYVINTMWPCALVLDLSANARQASELLASARQQWPDAAVVGLYEAQADKQLFPDIQHFVAITARPQKLLAAIRAQLPQTKSRSPSRNILQKRVQHMEKLLHTITLLAGNGEDAGVLQGLQVVGQQVLGAEMVAVLLTDDEYTELEDTLQLGTPQGYLEACRQLMHSVERAEDRLAYLGEEVLLSSVPSQTTPAPPSPFVPEAHALNASSYMRLPLNIGDRLVGFVALATRQPGHFKGEHLQLGRLFAAQVAAALRLVQLQGRQNELEGRQRSFSHIAQLIAEDDMALDAILAHILEEAVQLVNGDQGIILLSEPDGTLSVRAIYGLTGARLGDKVSPDVGQVGLILATRQPSAIAHYRSWPHASPSIRDKVSPDASVIGVPLIYQGQMLGILQVVCGYSTQPDVNEARDVLALLAPQAAIAIAKGRMHEELHEAMRQERRQLRAILEHIPVAVIVCDADGVIQRANRASEQLLRALGMNFESVRGQHVLEIIAFLLPEGLPAEIKLDKPFEVYLGAIGEYLITIAPIVGDESEIEAYVGVAQDVTALRRLDRMRANLNRILTHDLGNLLMLARTPLELLDEPDLPPEQRQQLKDMLTGSLERMSDLITDVMHMEIADSLGQQKFTPYALEKVVRRAVQRYRNTAQHVGVTLTYHKEKAPPERLLGHEVLIAQAIENLVSNALKYTPSGGRVDVTLTVEGENAVIRVEDTGYGIPQDKLDAIFEPFVRVKTPATRNIPGTGLGLNLVKQFIESHSGHVEVQSQPGKGSTFTICLPLHPQGVPRASEDRIPRLDLSQKVVGLSDTHPS